MFPPLKGRVQRPDPCSSRTPPAGEDLIGLIGCDRIGRRPIRDPLGLHPAGPPGDIPAILPGGYRVPEDLTRQACNRHVIGTGIRRDPSGRLPIGM